MMRFTVGLLHWLTHHGCVQVFSLSGQPGPAESSQLSSYLAQVLLFYLDYAHVFKGDLLLCIHFQLYGFTMEELKRSYECFTVQS